MFPSLKIVRRVHKGNVGDLPFAGQVQALSAIVPEGHADTRDGVENLEATNWLGGIARIPQTKLAVTHARKAGCRNAIRLAHPDSATVLCARVARNLLGRLLLSYIPHAQLLISACGYEVGTIGAPG